MPDTREVQAKGKQEVAGADATERLSQRKVFVPEADIYETETGFSESIQVGDPSRSQQPS